VPIKVNEYLVLIKQVAQIKLTFKCSNPRNGEGCKFFEVPFAAGRRMAGEVLKE
jgi:hypothetical protein